MIKILKILTVGQRNEKTDIVLIRNPACNIYPIFWVTFLSSFLICLIPSQDKLDVICIVKVNNFYILCFVGWEYL